tara:strand:+ start:3413 stop:4576 length:1164 start_codon:yes stop_codon:yes gene_type:complete
MDIVFGNIDVILTDNKTKISDNVRKQIKKINSKTALRRDMAQVVYFIINDKEIEDDIKIKLITQLQDMYNKAQKELAKKKNIQEEPDERVKNQQIDIVTRVGLSKQTNKNGNLLKFFNIHVESPRYPISAIDQVNSFLSDLTDEFEILMKPEEAEKLLEENAKYKFETNTKIVPNNFRKGKEPNDDKKNSAAPDLDDVEDAKNVSTSSPSEDEYESDSSDDSKSLGGKKRKTRKNRKNTGGSKLSLPQQRELRDKLQTRRKGTPYPRPRATERTWNEFGSKLLDKYLLFNDAKDSHAYDTLKKIENFPTKQKDIKNRTQTISEPLQKEIDAILEQRRNKAVEAVEKYNRKKEEQEQYDRLGGKKRKTKKNKKKNQKRKTSKRKQKQK